jgi:hypothetical protein
MNNTESAPTQNRVQGKREEGSGKTKLITSGLSCSQTTTRRRFLRFFTDCNNVRSNVPWYKWNGE